MRTDTMFRKTFARNERIVYINILFTYTTFHFISTACSMFSYSYMIFFSTNFS